MLQEWEKDYFVFNVPSSQTVDMILKVPSGVDYDITIYDSNGVYVTSSQNSSDTDEVFDESLSSGDYYAVIESYSGTDSVKTYSFIPY